MKKTLLTFVLLTFVVTTFAQLPFTFDLGIKGGINSSVISTANMGSVGSYTFSNFKNDAKSGFQIGAFARLGGKKVYLQPELLYVRKNGEVQFSYLNSTYYQKVSVNSVQIPILLGMKIINLKLASLRVFTGPAMSIAMSNSNVSAAINGLINDPNSIKNNIWDWHLGLGVDVGPLTLDVRKEWGITNVSDGNFSSSNIGFTNKANYLTFSIGFKFI